MEMQKTGERSRKTDSSITKICSTVLDLPPSCIEFCLAEPEYFVVGTYHLEKEDETLPQGQEDGKYSAENSSGGEKKLQKRNGSLILFMLKDNKL